MVLLEVIIPLSVFGSYILISLVLLRFPQLVHRKKKSKFPRCCRHISHRGGAAENLENTMTAYKHAVAVAGTNMLELDLQLSADGQVVVSHDNDLKRVTGLEYKISDLKYEELPLLMAAIPVQFEPGVVCETKNGDRKMPLLSEVFDAFPNIPINVDVKYPSDELIEKTHDLIVQYKREHMTVWGNVSAATTEKCYKMNSDIPLLFSIRRCTLLIVMFYTGLLPFVPLKESFLEIMLPSIILGRIELPRHQVLIAKVVEWLMISTVLFKHLERRGIQTFLWVLNREDEFEYAFDQLGVAGVMTDYPMKLREFLDRRQSVQSEEEPLRNFENTTYTQ